MKRRAKTGWIVYWLAGWLGFWFLIPEAACLFTDPSCTFSWSLWTVMERFVWVRWGVWLLLAWLAWHFTVDYRAWRKRGSGDV